MVVEKVISTHAVSGDKAGTLNSQIPPKLLLLTHVVCEYSVCTLVCVVHSDKEIYQADKFLC